MIFNVFNHLYTYRKVKYLKELRNDSMFSSFLAQESNSITRIHVYIRRNPSKIALRTPRFLKINHLRKSTKFNSDVHLKYPTRPQHKTSYNDETNTNNFFASSSCCYVIFFFFFSFTNFIEVFLTTFIHQFLCISTHSHFFSPPTLSSLSLSFAFLLEILNVCFLLIDTSTSELYNLCNEILVFFFLNFCKYNEKCL